VASGVLVRGLGVSKKGAYDLELDCLAVNVDGTNLKVDSYRAEITLRVGVFGEPQEQTRLDLETLSLSGTHVA
jgi:hypothetical protein